MSTITEKTVTTTTIAIEATQENLSGYRKFMKWAEGQEENRFGWLAAALATHGCALTPITLFAVVLAGNLFAFWVLSLVAMGLALVTNLAAMPTKVTIPAFFLSVVIDILIIAACVVIGFDASAALTV